MIQIYSNELQFIASMYILYYLRLIETRVAIKSIRLNHTEIWILWKNHQELNSDGIFFVSLPFDRKKKCFFYEKLNSNTSANDEEL